MTRPPTCMQTRETAPLTTSVMMTYIQSMTASGDDHALDPAVLERVTAALAQRK